MSSLANFYINFTRLDRFLISLFIRMRIIMGICTSAVISDALPVTKITFWKTKVASWNTLRS